MDVGIFRSFISTQLRAVFSSAKLKLWVDSFTAFSFLKTLSELFLLYLTWLASKLNTIFSINRPIFSGLPCPLNKETL